MAEGIGNEDAGGNVEEKYGVRIEMGPSQSLLSDLDIRSWPKGTDLRRGFVNHLYRALTNAGFRAFLDTYSLNRGDDISSTLHHAIEESRILMPIFSTNYAQSPWCLREASHIALQVVLQRQGNGSCIAIPLFYDVTPAQVRRPDQSGSPFAEAFKEHEMSGRYSPQEIHQWKAALFQLCRFSRWSLPEDFNGYEAALAKRVVEDVAKHCMTGRRSWPSI